MSTITGRRLNYFFKKISDVFPKKSIYGDTTVSMGRDSGSTTGTKSFAFGDSVTASGGLSHAEGSHTTASGYYSHSEGFYTTASGARSHSEGTGTTASGDYSHSEGAGTTASGDCSHSEGNYTKALAYQHVQGHYNDTTKATAGVDRGTGDSTAFCIGNGTNATASNAVRIDYNGKIWCKQAYSSTGADYAEMFEWLDGNPNNEDRRGYFVTMDGEKIRKAEQGEWILGIVSANPCILGNTDMEWQGQFLRDEFNDFIIEEGEETVTETVYERDKDGNVVYGDDGSPISHEVKKKIPYLFYKVNPAYDPNEEYIFRLDRKEWDAVGMVGVLAVRDDGTCKVNGFCTCAAGGIATESETGYRVISRVNDHIIKVVLV